MIKEGMLVKTSGYGPLPEQNTKYVSWSFSYSKNFGSGS
jgi:hypothetical protein